MEMAEIKKHLDRFISNISPTQGDGSSPSPANLLTSEASPLFIWSLLAVGWIFYLTELFFYHLGPFGQFSNGIAFLNDLSKATPELILDTVWRMTFYPPLYHLFIAVAGIFLTFDHNKILFINALLILPATVYLTATAKLMGLGRWSFLPTLLLLLFPGTLEATSCLSIEALLMLIITAFAYHLLKSGRFHLRGPLLLAGFWAGLGLLTKWTFPGYVLGLILIILATVFYDFNNRIRLSISKVQIKNIGLGLGLALLISGWWYIFKLDWTTLVSVSGNDPNLLEPSILKNIQSYFFGLGELTGGTMEAALGAVLLICLIFSRKPLHLLVTASAWLAVAIAAISLSTHLETRYLYPLLPFCALMISLAVANLRFQALQVILALSLIGLTAYTHFTFLDQELKPIGFNNYEQPGIHPETDLVVRFLISRNRGLPATVCVHPFWSNYHLKPSYLRYSAHTHKAIKQLRFRNSFYFNYGLFNRDLTRQAINIVILDCGAEGDCRSVNPNMVNGYLQKAARFDYGDQEGFNPTFSQETVDRDLDLIAAEFSEIAYLPFDDGTYTRILYSKRFLKQLADLKP